MPKKLLWVLAGVAAAVVVAAGLVGIKLSQFDAMQEVAAQLVIPPTGSVEAVQGTVINTEVQGIVRDIHFTAGAEVKAGDVLVQLDDELEQASLREAEATLDAARTTLARARELSKTRNISQLELDSAETGMRQAQAQLDYTRAVIAKKTLRAPFDGTLGIRRVSVGQFLEQGTPVVSLQSLSPVYVEFSLPQRRLAEVAQGLRVEVSADAYPQQRFAGEVIAFNPDIDPNTRNVRVQALLDNPDAHLRPGMFVTVDLILAHTRQVLFIPATAVQHGPYGDAVYVIEDGDGALMLRQQLVRLGERQGDFVMVNEGLQAGERIVSTGGFKLAPGMAVVIDNTLAPDFKLNPDPDNS